MRQTKRLTNNDFLPSQNCNGSIEYEDENIKSLGYKVVAGSNKLQTEAQKFVTSRNTKAKKKE